MVKIMVGIEGMACGMCEAHINEKHSNLGTVLFAAGFTVMMALDVALETGINL